VQTFRQWFLDDDLFGPYGGGNPNVSGFFFDAQFDGATESAGTLKSLGMIAAEGAVMSADY
jgi:hypothetical protein